MADIVEQVIAVLATVAPAGGVHYAVNQASPVVAPFFVLLRITSNSNVSMQGASNMQNTRFQVDIYSKTVAELVQLGAQVNAAMALAAFSSVPLIATDLYESETRLFRTTQDFSIWSKD